MTCPRLIARSLRPTYDSSAVCRLPTTLKSGPAKYHLRRSCASSNCGGGRTNAGYNAQVLAAPDLQQFFGWRLLSRGAVRWASWHDGLATTTPKTRWLSGGLELRSIGVAWRL